MKKLNQWYAEYSESHQNKTNKQIHFICVPIIFFSIVGMLMCIPSSNIQSIIRINTPLTNWATLALLLVLLFYLKMSFSVFLKMLIFSAICIYGNYYIKQHMPLFYTSLALFILAWIGQFIGHHIEGKKPSFLKDLQFLLIGPAWVFEKLF